MKILLIRHGETTGDLEDRYGGDYDDHLTEKGRQQLEATGKSLEGRTVDMIFVSPLIRARESAEIINKTLNTRIEVVEDLRERSYGVLAGLTKAEAAKQFPEAVELHKDPVNTDPDGEPQTDFIQRVIAAYTHIHDQAQGDIIILSHGGTLKTILRHLEQPVPDTIRDGEVIDVEL